MDADTISTVDAILRPNPGCGLIYNRRWTRFFFFILWTRSSNRRWTWLILHSTLDAIPLLLTSLDAVSQMTGCDYSYSSSKEVGRSYSTGDVECGS